MTPTEELEKFNRIINGHITGKSRHPMMVAELSCNISTNFHRSKNIGFETIEAAKHAGADAVKLQTYTPDTLTLDPALLVESNKHWFDLPQHSNWRNHGVDNLYQLYSKTYIPWDLQKEYIKFARSLGMLVFSSPFDETAVKFLAEQQIPALKIASYERKDLNFVKFAAAHTHNLIVSFGNNTTIQDIQDSDIHQGMFELDKLDNFIALHCVNGYPTPLRDARLTKMSELFAISNRVGLSDHSKSYIPAIVATALDACMIETHFKLDDHVTSPDADFSITPVEYRYMVEEVKDAHYALGRFISDLNSPSPSEQPNLIFQRSLFVVQDIKKGERFTAENVKSIRPGHGDNPKYLNKYLGSVASQDISKGTPLEPELRE